MVRKWRRYLRLGVGGGKGHALLYTDTTTNTQELRDECDLRIGRDFDAQLARADNGAGLFAFLSTFLRLNQSIATRIAATNTVPWACTTRAHMAILAFEEFRRGGVVGHLVGVDYGNTDFVSNCQE